MISVALQEWSVICDQLASGRLSLAVRKGGIHERQGGLFTLEHDRFALMPTYLHQDPARLRQPTVVASPAASDHTITCWAEAARIWRLTDRRSLDALSDRLPWSDAELDARFAYRGQPFLFVLALRVHRLPAPSILPDHASYAGCRSWIPLQRGIDTAGSTPVLDDTAWNAQMLTLAATLPP